MQVSVCFHSVACCWRRYWYSRKITENRILWIIVHYVMQLKSTMMILLHKNHQKFNEFQNSKFSKFSKLLIIIMICSSIMWMDEQCPIIHVSRPREKKKTTIAPLTPNPPNVIPFTFQSFNNMFSYSLSSWYVLQSCHEEYPSHIHSSREKKTTIAPSRRTSSFFLSFTNHSKTHQTHTST